MQERNLTDLGNAERFVADHRGRVRYCPPRKRWLVWDGKHWQWDYTGEAQRLAKRTVRGILSGASRLEDKDQRTATVKHAFQSEAIGRMKALLHLASTEPGIPVMPDELDVDPDLLCVANGTLDLRTGKLQPHRREDMITRIVPIAYDPHARSKLWEGFLLDTTAGDLELLAFLRRAAGYAATGRTSERKFLFCYGPSTTGKSTFVDALRCALGGYAADLDFDSLLQQQNRGSNRGDLVRLAGSRIAFACEVRRRAKFDAKLVKAIAGGDPLTAAAKYEAEITFTPTFTLLLAANDAPYIHDDDDGMWRRCVRIPFDRTVEVPDPTVKARLSDPTGPDAAAVLAWIVRGAVEWREHGLCIPDVVKRSTEAYRAEVDVFAGFLAECCELDHDANTQQPAFRKAYLAWCEENGVRHPLAGKDLEARLARDQVLKGKVRGERIWRGVRLR